MIKEAKEKSLIEVLGTQEMLSVPYFQRRYVWKEENWEEMLNTIIDESKDVTDGDSNSVYWGNIIWKEIDTKQGQSKCYKIIDGQQRITTLSILLLAIYNSINEKSQNLKNTIKSILLVNNNLRSNTDEDADIKLLLSIVDRIDYCDLVEPLKTDQEISKEKLNEKSKYNSKVKDCYKYFMEKMRNSNDDQLYELFKVCTNNDKRFVLITLDKDTQNEQSIFDTLNRAGQRLTSAEIIKNALYEKISKQEGVQEDYVVKLCNDNWDEIFELIEDNEDNKWYKTEKIGNNVWTQIEHLMYFISMIEWSNDKPLQLESVYTNEIKRIDEEDGVQQLAKKIKDYAIIYKKYIMEFDEKQPLFANVKLKNKIYYYRTLLVINKCDLKMMYPYLLKLLYDYYDNESEECDIENESFVSEMQKVTKFVLRNSVCDMKYSNGITRTVINIINDINGISSVMLDAKNERETKKSKYDMSKNELEANLKNLHTNLATLLLFLIELDNYDSAKDINMTYTYELEHIMPIKWEKYWGKEYNSLDDKTEDDKIKKETFARRRDEHIKYIGNMLLIRKSLNSSIKNREIETKINGDEKRSKNKHKGYRDCCAMYLVNDFVVNYYDKNQTWNEEEIESRTTKLASMIRKMCEWE